MMDETKYTAEPSEEKEMAGQSVEQNKETLSNEPVGNAEVLEKSACENSNEETNENNEELKEEAKEELKEELKEEVYAFRWDYAEQCSHDKGQEKARKPQKSRGVLVYAIVMTVAFLVAFSILAASLALNNISEWFKPDEDDYSISDVVEIGMPSSLAIFSYISETTGTTGSGFAITANGYLITNYHVVKNAISVTVVDSNDTSYAASVIGYDEKLDLAVLYAEGARFTPVTIGNSDELRLGEEVVAIGCPNGQNFMFSVSNGIVSGLGRILESGYPMIQTNAPLNPGNSGGPLFDSKGNVIGIVTSKLVSTEVEDQSEIALEGMAFAIPINSAMALAEKYIADDLKTPMLGVTAIAVEAGKTYYVDNNVGRRYECVEEGGKLYYINEYNTKMELTDGMLGENNYLVEAIKDGVVITNVTKGLGADGVLLPKDLVTKVNGVEVKTVEEVKQVFKTLNAGDYIEVEFYRDGKLKNATMILKTKGDMLRAEANN